ncbi:S-adenosyl-L-methionine-dependent methyltransferase [Ilyonectria robusta]|uniref:S-adenosyl-L-methionine-dependent methyltransferase n=1 Tax=Ilyonectria robusta TaxID=1079257 RepID=UPI001E8E4FA1|nr:S-adenosyl-L-methionine-dependent methyltransferase [Ilyonectria robusta]KAH8654208.1 S-adenosyl-L-methionine-dependent methyltransferase [Ilyonectria robusta]
MEGHIEAGINNENDELSTSDADSAVSISRSSTTSITPSIWEHEYINGRRYHNFRSGRYPLPNDDREQDREDMMHRIMLQATNGKLIYALIDEDPQNIVDLGTGTGIWAIEAADDYPSAQVIGLDLSPIQPDVVPPNVTFIVDDIEDEWLNGDNFDLVHLRHVMPYLESPEKVLKKAFCHMKPGAWIELQDIDHQCHSDDDTIPDNWPVTQLYDLLVDAFQRFGGNARAADLGGEYLTNAGFINIQHNYVKLPFGPWPLDKKKRYVGQFYREACKEFFPALAARHFPKMGWTSAETEVFLAECREAMKDCSVHAYSKMHFWSGQKSKDAK